MKKLSAIIVCLLMIITCTLAGCATFSIDKVKYYNEVVATVGEENITRYDLLNAYSSYGQNYYASQLGQSEQDALKNTLDLLTKRESLYQWAKENITLTAYEVNSAVEDMFKSLDEQMTSYVSTAKRIFNISVGSSSSKADSETAYKLSDYTYTPRATITSQGSIKYLVSEKQYTPIIAEEYLTDPLKAGVVDEVKTKYLTHFYDSLVNEERRDDLFNKSKALLANDLINYEYYLRDAENKPYNTVTDDLLFRYFERNYTSQIKGSYLTKIRSDYLLSATETGKVNTTKLLTEYKDLYTQGYDKYVNRPEQYKTDMANIVTNADDMLYHPTFTDGTKFGYFVHTLIGFDGNQSKYFEAAKADYKVSSGEDEVKEKTYNDRLDSILSPMTATERDLETGLLIKDAEDNAVKHDIQYVIDEYKKVNTLKDFIDFMFRFSTDTATLSAGMPYVLGCDATYDGVTLVNEGTDKESYKGAYSGMVAEFTKEALDLMNKGLTMSQKLDQVDASKMCISTYGIHFVYFVDVIDPINDPDPNTAYFSNVVKSGDNLCKTLNPLTGETYFDKLFDAVYPVDSNEEVYASVDSYDVYEANLIDNSKITIYETKLKGTRSSL